MPPQPRAATHVDRPFLHSNSSSVFTQSCCEELLCSDLVWHRQPARDSARCPPLRVLSACSACSKSLSAASIRSAISYLCCSFDWKPSAESARRLVVWAGEMLTVGAGRFLSPCAACVNAIVVWLGEGRPVPQREGKSVADQSRLLNSVIAVGKRG